MLINKYNEYINLRYIILLLVVLTLFISFNSNIYEPYFLFIHDEYFPVPGKEIANLFSTYNQNDLGVSNILSLIVTIFDRGYYYASYNALDLDIYNAQKLLYIIKLSLLAFIPYFGFNKLIYHLIEFPDKNVIFLSSIWYSFNTYTLIYWHGNAFSLTLLVTYVLGPICLYLWDVSILKRCDNKLDLIKNLLKLSLTLFFMSFSVYLFAPFIILIFIYSILRVLIEKIDFIKFSLRIILLFLLCLPLFSINYIVIYDFFLLSVEAKNTTGSETFGNLDGGLLYMALMWFTWPIYTIWAPRNIYSFSEYFRYTPSLIAPFFLYFLIFWGGIKKKCNLVLIFVLLVLVFFMLIKGPQEPFGIIYKFLIENIPGFMVFRSPDTKFGFVIVFCISILLSITGSRIKNKLFFIILSIVILIQNYPLITGVAIKGENTIDSYDRVIYIPADYKELANYLNNDKSNFGYLMPIPSSKAGRFFLDEFEEHSGQDILSKIINIPFLYIDESSGMPKRTYEKINNIKKNHKYKDLERLPIKYFLVRYDVEVGKKEEREFLQYIVKNHSMVFKNNTFILYENKNVKPLVQYNIYNFEKKKPTWMEFDFNFNEENGLIVLRQNYNNAWKVYDVGQYNNVVSILLTLPWNKSILENRHMIGDGYANAWIINDDSLSVLRGKKLAVIYWPQLLFNFLSFISIFFTCIYVVIIFSIRKNKQK